MSPVRALYAAEARAEWQNLLAMAVLPGRRVTARTVRRLGRAAGAHPSVIAAALVAVGARA